MWIALSYCAFLSFIVGHLWRQRHDGFRCYSSGAGLGRAERFGSAVFGLAASVIVVARIADVAASGHDSHPDNVIHLIITIAEALAIPSAIVGAAILLIPNLITATAGPLITPLDHVTFPVLTAALLSRILIRFDPNSSDGRYRSAEILFTWIRSMLTFHPNADMISHAPFLYQARAVFLLLLIAIWPYTRLAGTFARPICGAIKALVSGRATPQYGSSTRCR